MGLAFGLHRKYEQCKQNQSPHIVEPSIDTTQSVAKGVQSYSSCRRPLCPPKKSGRPDPWVQSIKPPKNLQSWTILYNLFSHGQLFYSTVQLITTFLAYEDVSSLPVFGLNRIFCQKWWCMHSARPTIMAVHLNCTLCTLYCTSWRVWQVSLFGLISDQQYNFVVLCPPNTWLEICALHTETKKDTR